MRKRLQTRLFYILVRNNCKMVEEDELFHQITLQRTIGIRHERIVQVELSAKSDSSDVPDNIISHEKWNALFEKCDYIIRKHSDVAAVLACRESPEGSGSRPCHCATKTSKPSSVRKFADRSRKLKPAVCSITPTRTSKASDCSRWQWSCRPAASPTSSCCCHDAR